MVVLIIALLAVWPSWHFGGEQGLRALLWSGGVCLVATVISLAPLVVALRRQADWLAQACLGGTVIRLLLTMFVGGAVYFAAKPPMMTFALCVMAFYLGLLAWETRVAVGFINEYYSRYPSTSNEQKITDDDNKPPEVVGRSGQRER